MALVANLTWRSSLAMTRHAADLTELCRREISSKRADCSGRMPRRPPPVPTYLRTKDGTCDFSLPQSKCIGASNYFAVIYLHGFPGVYAMLCIYRRPAGVYPQPSIIDPLEPNPSSFPRSGFSAVPVIGIVLIGHAFPGGRMELVMWTPTPCHGAAGSREEKSPIADP